ncbi:MAG TPA: hypothetical protein VMR18_02035 [Candidatus Saccharimonadales bacterium]|jgi:hypothetical protein|nr:hypothetical protein [Candidatus Saccharimonadales bacterium]
MSECQAESAVANATDTSHVEPDTSNVINREPAWPLVPPSLARQIISSPALRLGTLEEVAGVEAADEFFNRPDPFKEARESALREIGKFVIL